jgi:hypothetical protein
MGSRLASRPSRSQVKNPGGVGDQEVSDQLTLSWSEVRTPRDLDFWPRLLTWVTTPRMKQPPRARESRGGCRARVPAGLTQSYGSTCRGPRARAPAYSDALADGSSATHPTPPPLL